MAADRGSGTPPLPSPPRSLAVLAAVLSLGAVAPLAGCGGGEQDDEPVILAPGGDRSSAGPGGDRGGATAGEGRSRSSARQGAGSDSGQRDASGVSAPSGGASEPETVDGSGASGGTAAPGSADGAAGPGSGGAADSPGNDVPPEPGTPQDRFERWCEQHPGSCG